MKQIFILLLFFWYQSQAQTPLFLAPAQDAAPDADYTTYITAVEATGAVVPAAIKTAENNFVVALKTAGLWDRMKFGYFMYRGNKAGGKINMKNTATLALTEVNTVTFDDGMGIRSDRYSSYYSQPFKSDAYAGIETDLTTIQYINEDNGVPLQSFSHGMRTNAAGTAAFSLYPFYSSGIGYKYHSTASFEFTSSNSEGLYVTTYDGTNVVNYKDGTKDSDAATPSAPTYSVNRLLMSVNAATLTNTVSPSTYYNRAISADFGFDRFNDADELAFRTAFTSLITAINTYNAKRIENSSHGWFIREKAVYHAGSNKTFIGQVHGPNNLNYSQYIFQIDNATGAKTSFRVGSQIEQDDHNEPSILIRASDSRLFSGYTEHSGTTIRWRISTNPTDISAWGSEQTFDPAPGRVFTYITTYQDVAGDIYMFFRDATVSGGATSQWSYVKSTDNGATFGSYTTYSDYTYSTATQDPNNKNIIHFVVSEHPGDGDFPNTIGTFYMDLSTDTFHKTDGTNITGSIPLDASDVTIVQSNNSPVQCWLEDIIIDGGGNPRILFNLIPDETTSLTKDEYYTEWSGSAWTTPHLLHRASSHYMETDLPSAQDIDSKWYAPLGSFDRGNPDRIFSSKEVSGVCEIFELTRISSSSFTSQQKTFNSSYDNWRPFTVDSPVNNVFWTIKIYYDHWITNYKEDLKFDTY